MNETGMNVLILGGGGREHAIGWAIQKSQRAESVYFAPGNAGTSSCGINVQLSILDGDAIRTFCDEYTIGLVIVGPEQPLVVGVADVLREARIPVMGPSAAAARLEGSKSFAKDFMQRHNIPTAAHRTFGSHQLADALAFVNEEGAPIVVKASGLAGGKGAIVCMTLDEAQQAVNDLMRDRILGDAGEEVVIESFMSGEEASVFAVSDGENYVLLSTAQDHKRVGDGDMGPNTGGMGAYAPAPVMTQELLDRTCAEIIEPTLTGMKSEGSPYSGVLYCGLMITDEGPQVVEFNCRLGDPETQVILPLISSDVLELFYASATGTIADHKLNIRSGSSACVVLASAGYPGSYETGKRISGLNQNDVTDSVVVFQAGTSESELGETVTSGGRVLAVSSTNEDLQGAITKVYQACAEIDFEGVFYRSDIGMKGLSRSVPT